ncbi:hypothetical protein KIN20_003089 [Parelaphostrongylus tenuis]|uniref:Uncharacterized protein n=1 Tax=Parelaphostrongylus tenuis TaxID=148309 RepID=A0AAD5MPE8_PARTN|nr:hypothetical protein KIN20_003089 [Parelaphostrongylus tenuis]
MAGDGGGHNDGSNDGQQAEMNAASIESSRLCTSSNEKNLGKRKFLTGEYDYPESGTKFAQSLLCISFDVDALPAISQYMRFAQVTPFIKKLPQSIKLL